MKSCASACCALSVGAWQVGALEQMFVQPHRTLVFAPATKQVT
jgi:hypothetical protein